MRKECFYPIFTKNKLFFLGNFILAKHNKLKLLHVIIKIVVLNSSAETVYKYHVSAH